MSRRSPLPLVPLLLQLLTSYLTCYAHALTRPHPPRPHNIPGDLDLLYTPEGQLGHGGQSYGGHISRPYIPLVLERSVTLRPRSRVTESLLLQYPTNPRPQTHDPGRVASKRPLIPRPTPLTRLSQARVEVRRPQGKLTTTKRPVVIETGGWKPINDSTTRTTSTWGSDTWYDPRYASNHRWGNVKLQNDLNNQFPLNYRRWYDFPGAYDIYDMRYFKLRPLEWSNQRRILKVPPRHNQHDQRDQRVSRNSLWDGGPLGLMSLFVSSLTVLFMASSVIGKENVAPILPDVSQITSSLRDIMQGSEKKGPRVLSDSALDPLRLYSEGSLSLSGSKESKEDGSKKTEGTKRRKRRRMKRSVSKVIYSEEKEGIGDKELNEGVKKRRKEKSEWKVTGIAEEIREIDEKVSSSEIESIEENEVTGKNTTRSRKEIKEKVLQENDDEEKKEEIEDKEEEEEKEEEEKKELQKQKQQLPYPSKQGDETKTSRAERLIRDTTAHLLQNKSGTGRQLASLSQIALSAAMVLGAYAGYAIINTNKKDAATPATKKIRNKLRGEDLDDETINTLIDLSQRVDSSLTSSSPFTISPVTSTLPLIDLWEQVEHKNLQSQVFPTGDGGTRSDVLRKTDMIFDSKLPGMKGQRGEGTVVTSLLDQSDLWDIKGSPAPPDLIRSTGNDFFNFHSQFRDSTTTTTTAGPPTTTQGLMMSQNPTTSPEPYYVYLSSLPPDITTSALPNLILQHAGSYLSTSPLTTGTYPLATTPSITFERLNTRPHLSHFPVSTTTTRPSSNRRAGSKKKSKRPTSQKSNSASFSSQSTTTKRPQNRRKGSKNKPKGSTTAMPSVTAFMNPSPMSTTTAKPYTRLGGKPEDTPNLQSYEAYLSAFSRLLTTPESLTSNTPQSPKPDFSFLSTTSRNTIQGWPSDQAEILPVHSGRHTTPNPYSAYFSSTSPSSTRKSPNYLITSPTTNPGYFSSTLPSTTTENPDYSNSTPETYSRYFSSTSLPSFTTKGSNNRHTSVIIQPKTPMKSLPFSVYQPQKFGHSTTPAPTTVVSHTLNFERDQFSSRPTERPMLIQGYDGNKDSKPLLLPEKVDPILSFPDFYLHSTRRPVLMKGYGSEGYPKPSRTQEDQEKDQKDDQILHYYFSQVNPTSKPGFTKDYYDFSHFKNPSTSLLLQRNTERPSTTDAREKVTSRSAVRITEGSPVSLPINLNQYPNPSFYTPPSANYKHPTSSSLVTQLPSPIQSKNLTTVSYILQSPSTVAHKHPTPSSYTPQPPFSVNYKHPSNPSFSITQSPSSILNKHPIPLSLVTGMPSLLFQHPSTPSAPITQTPSLHNKHPTSSSYKPRSPSLTLYKHPSTPASYNLHPTPSPVQILLTTTKPRTTTTTTTTTTSTGPNKLETMSNPVLTYPNSPGDIKGLQMPIRSPRPSATHDPSYFMNKNHSMSQVPHRSRPSLQYSRQEIPKPHSTQFPQRQHPVQNTRPSLQYPKQEVPKPHSTQFPQRQHPVQNTRPSLQYSRQETPKPQLSQMETRPQIKHWGLTHVLPSTKAPESEDLKDILPYNAQDEEEGDILDSGTIDTILSLAKREWANLQEEQSLESLPMADLFTQSASTSDNSQPVRGVNVNRLGHLNIGDSQLMDHAMPLRTWHDNTGVEYVAIPLLFNQGKNRTLGQLSHFLLDGRDQETELSAMVKTTPGRILPEHLGRWTVDHLTTSEGREATAEGKVTDSTLQQYLQKSPRSDHNTTNGGNKSENGGNNNSTLDTRPNFFTDVWNLWTQRKSVNVDHLPSSLTQDQSAPNTAVTARPTHPEPVNTHTHSHTLRRTTPNLQESKSDLGNPDVRLKQDSNRRNCDFKDHSSDSRQGHVGTTPRGLVTWIPSISLSTWGSITDNRGEEREQMRSLVARPSYGTSQPLIRPLGVTIQDNMEEAKGTVLKHPLGTSLPTRPLHLENEMETQKRTNFKHPSGTPRLGTGPPDKEKESFLENPSFRTPELSIEPHKLALEDGREIGNRSLLEQIPLETQGLPAGSPKLILASGVYDTATKTNHKQGHPSVTTLIVSKQRNDSHKTRSLTKTRDKTKQHTSNYSRGLNYGEIESLPLQPPKSATVRSPEIVFLREPDTHSRPQNKRKPVQGNNIERQIEHKQRGHVGIDQLVLPMSKKTGDSHEKMDNNHVFSQPVPLRESLKKTEGIGVFSQAQIPDTKKMENYRVTPQTMLLPVQKTEGHASLPYPLTLNGLFPIKYSQ
ncbi:hypothetical protein E2C01_034750 [Portunus trituberculatus]|uniref:Uncharacterized protein n=1 Tax=Portunus trituberculatus TaxID=210409 RepID=A0A5B7F6D2_PORTR|nr:hypothetical protein [Portunus trituberculatus]